MALVTPSINNVNLNMSISPPVVIPLLESLAVVLPVFFNNVSDLQVLSGSFTPNNNQLGLLNGISNNLAPNFIILITDAQANLLVKSGATVLIDSSPVMKLFFNTMVANSTYNISDIYLDGTTAATTPMPQNTLVNYTLIVGQATIG